MKKLLLILLLAVVGGKTNWFALNAQEVPTVTSRAKSHWREKYPTPLKDTVLSNFDGGAGVEWVRISGDSMLNDVELVKNGTQSIRAYCSGVTNCLMRKTFPSSKDLTIYDFFTITFHISDANKYQIDSSGGNCFNIQLGTNTSNAFGKQISLSTINDFSGSGWYKIQIHKNILVKAGTVTWDNITTLYITLLARNGISRKVTLDQFTACKSATPKGGVVFWLDASSDSTCKYANKLFGRYNINYTMSAKAEAATTVPESLIVVQNLRNDVVVYPWNPVDLTTYTPAGIDTQINKVKDYLVNYGLRGNPIIAFSQSMHNRVVDSVCYARGFDYGRGLGISTFATNIKWMAIPSYSEKYTIGHFTYIKTPIDSLKRIVDSARTYNTVNTILLHGVTTDTGVSTLIDTGKLDLLLKYCDSLRIEQSIGYVGKLTNYLLYAPDSCIENKSHIDNTIVDSIAKLADSMRVVLKVLNGTEWDSIAGSPMKKGGELCTLSVSGLTGTYTVKSFGVANSGHIDSGNIAYEATFTSSIEVTTQPQNDTVISGLPGMFSIAYTGESVNVAWYKNGVFTGTYGATLRITGNNGDSVQAVLWNAEDTVSSSMAYLYVVNAPFDTAKINSFDYVNSSGNTFPSSGWSIRIVRGVGDTVNTSITSQNEYGFTGITPEQPLPARSRYYTMILVNGEYTITRKLYFSKEGQSGVIFYFGGK